VGKQLFAGDVDPESGDGFHTARSAVQSRIDIRDAAFLDLAAQVFDSWLVKDVLHLPARGRC